MALLICTTTALQKPSLVRGCLSRTPLWADPCSTVGRGAYSALFKDNYWIWMSEENPKKTDSKSVLCPIRLTSIHGTMFNVVFFSHLSFSSCLCRMVGPHFWSHVCTELFTTGILSKVALRPPSKK